MPEVGKSFLIRQWSVEECILRSREGCDGRRGGERKNKMMEKRKE